MVTHNMEIVAGTDRMVRLTQGRVEGAPEAHGDPILAPASVGGG